MTGAYGHRCIVVGNGFFGVARAIDGLVPNSIVTGNTFFECERGIQPSAITADCDIFGNLFEYGTLTTGFAIRIYGGLRNHITDNVIIGYQYGIVQDTGTTNYIEDNVLTSCANYIVVTAGTATIRRNTGYVTENNVLSPAFAIDAVAVEEIIIPHGLATTPAMKDCSVTVTAVTVVDDWECGFVKVVSTDVTNVTVRVNVTKASATGGATAKLALRADVR